MLRDNVESSGTYSFEPTPQVKGIARISWDLMEQGI